MKKIPNVNVIKKKKSNLFKINFERESIKERRNQPNLFLSNKYFFKFQKLYPR